MRFTINQAALLEPLQLVASVVERKQTLPILANLLLSVDAKGLSLTGTDQEVEIGAHTSNLDCQKAGEITIPARKLLDICRSLPDSSSMAFNLEENRLCIESGRFKSYLVTLPAVDFPKVQIEDADVQFTLAAGLLHGMLQKTGFAMAQQDVRFFFNGLLVEVAENRVRFVATNGQRLATSFTTDTEKVDQEKQYIVPRKSVNEWQKLVPDNDDQRVVMRFTANHMQVECGDAILTTRLIDATYPDYRKAIPESGDKVVVGDRQEIREALIRTAILSNEVYRNVRLGLSKGRLDLHSNNPLHEEAEESVIVDYDGDDLEIGFNVGYLIDALSVIDGERVVMTFSDANSACLLADPDAINSSYVISPMML